jgi:glucose/arabinose dehydrogenase
MRSNLRFCLLVAASCLWGCEASKLPVERTQGPNPTLPDHPNKGIALPHYAPARGWAPGTRPVAAKGAGVSVDPFATGLNHPRWIYVLPNGDVLVAESNAPPQSLAHTGYRKWAAWFVLWRSGAGVESPNRIRLLRDADGDGKAEINEVFLEGLHSPFGMALIGNDLYVANSDALLRFPYREGAKSISAQGVEVIKFPPGPVNHHWTRNILASRDGSRIYAAVGSNSDHMEHGKDRELERAAIWEIDPKARTKRLFAQGLRNPNGMGWEPRSGVLWTVVNERDELGSDLVPDYLTSVREGDFYGWPYCYYGKADTRVPPEPGIQCDRTRKPEYSLGNHVAPLGLAFAEGAALPAPFQEGAFIGQHGSWNRNPKIGYDVVFVPFVDGKPSAGPPIPLVVGFLDAHNKHAQGRPVGVAIDKRGALLVADDVGNAIWRVTAKPPP